MARDLADVVGVDEALVGFAGSPGGFTNEQSIRDLSYAAENGSIVLDVPANDIDPDGADEFLFTTDAASQGGAKVTFTGIAGDGLVYEVGDTFQHLAAGETSVDTVTSMVSNSDGGLDTQTVSVTILGEDHLFRRDVLRRGCSGRFPAPWRRLDMQ